MSDPQAGKASEPGGFASDPTDGRTLCEWRTRYPDPKAQRKIKIEFTYLGLLLFGCPLVLLWWWQGGIPSLLGLSPSSAPTVGRYFFAWIGGTLAGSMFALKWLYHVVARSWWNEDRWIWRVATPHLSGSLGFSVYLVMSSGFFGVFDVQTLRLPRVAVATGFLVGYFSDTALGKLAEIADALFGTRNTDGRKEHMRGKPTTADPR